MIYFDNASTTYVYDDVIDTIAEILKNHWGNPANLYNFGLESAKLVEEARQKVADAIGALPEEIIFTSCASESNAFAINQREKCFCSAFEHHDQKENKKSIVIDEDYLFSLNEYDDYTDTLYSHMLVNNETGEIFNLDKQIKAAHKLGMWVLVDATQALGNIPINIHELDCEFASFSFHKVHAPKGIGALYIKKSIQNKINPLIYGSQEFNLRGGTSNVPYIVGAGNAVYKSISELQEKENHTLKLRRIIIDGLVDSNIPFIVNQGLHNVPCILNIAFSGITGEALMLALDNEGICVSTGSACNSGDLKPSEVLTAMGVPEEYIQGAIRISMSLKNTEQEAQALVEAIIKCYNELKG